MRVLLLIGALVGILATARRWDQMHPLRSAARSQALAGEAPDEPYLDLKLLRRRGFHPQAAPSQALDSLEIRTARKPA